MRAAAILGLGCSSKNLKPFQIDDSIDWRIGMPDASDRADAILIFGGDGTIHRHLSQLVSLNLPVLVVPAGSGNDFARALELHRAKDSLAAWKRFRAKRDNVRAIDLGVLAPLPSMETRNRLAESRATGDAASRYFCSIAGIGLDAEVARRANGLPRWLRGSGGYALSLAPTIFRFAPQKMKILTMEGAEETSQNPTWATRSDQPTILAAFANTPTYGGGMKIAPRAHSDDGLLDACIVGNVNPFTLFGLFPTVYFGRHLGVRKVEYFQARSVRVETERPLDVYADGEYVCQTPVEISARPNALKIITHSTTVANDPTRAKTPDR
jgi:diacylglycerol kinase (ATP)